MRAPPWIEPPPAEPRIRRAGHDRQQLRRAVLHPLPKKPPVKTPTLASPPCSEAGWDDQRLTHNYKRCPTPLRSLSGTGPACSCGIRRAAFVARRGQRILQSKAPTLGGVMLHCLRFWTVHCSELRRRRAGCARGLPTDRPAELPATLRSHWRDSAAELGHHERALDPAARRCEKSAGRAEVIDCVGDCSSIAPWPSFF